MNPWKRESWLLALIVTALFLLPSPVAAGSGSSAVSAGKVTVAGELSPAVPAGPVSPGVSSPLAPTNCPPQVSVPITLQNAYSMVTGSYDQMVQVNSTHYAPYLNANWSNVLFLLPNQTAIPAWIESGASPTADQTIVWLHMPSLSAAQSLTIYLVIYAKSCDFLSAKGPVGEAPQLSPVYGEYDTGRQIFRFYDNFSGTVLNPGYGVISGGGATISLSNSFNISGGTYGGVVWNTGFATPFVFDADVTRAMGAYPGLFLMSGDNTTSSTGYALLATTPTSSCSACGVAWGNIPNGVSPGSPSLQLTTGIMGGAWGGSANQTWYVNYTEHPGSMTYYSFPSLEYVSFGKANSGAGSMTLQWVRVRSLPLSGVMPSAVVGGFTFVTAGTPSPSAPVLDLGQTVNLTANPTGGNPPYSVQWYGTNTSTCPAGSPIPGATGVQYAASPTTSTYYCYHVTDSLGLVANSSAALVTVDPALTAGPLVASGTTLDAGQTVTLTSAPAGGALPYHYQWFTSTGATPCSSASTPIAGANSAATNVTVLSTSSFCYTLTDASMGYPAAAATSPSYNVTVRALLTAAAPSASGAHLDLGQMTTFTANPSGGTLPYAYQWFQSAAAGVCSPSDAAILGATNATLQVTPAASGVSYYCYEVTDGSTGSPAAIAFSTTVSLHVSPPLQAGNISLSATFVDQGEWVSLSANAVGGTAPYAYQWSQGTSANCGNDTRIPGATNSSYRAVPTRTTYFCYTVTDSADGAPAGTATSATARIQFQGAPAVLTFGAHPAQIETKHTTYLNASVSGGVAPYTYQYFNLPAGCATANLSSLSCTPTTAGNYTVTVVVTDSHGLAAGAQLVLTVTSPPSHSPGTGLSSTDLLLVVAILVGIVVGLAVALIVGRRRSHQPPASKPLEGSSGGGSPGPAPTPPGETHIESSGALGQGSPGPIAPAPPSPAGGGPASTPPSGTPPPPAPPRILCALCHKPIDRPGATCVFCGYQNSM